MSKVCFLDMDGVLVDFVSGALSAHQKSLPMKDVLWDFPSQVGFASADDPSFWEPLGFDFWANLDWTREGKRLLAAVETVFGDRVVLLSSPCETPGAVEGKVEWIRRNLLDYSRRFLIGPPKHLVAGPGKVLIDDQDANVERFQRFGGGGILVPRPWNCLKEHTDQDGSFCLETLAQRIRLEAEL